MEAEADPTAVQDQQHKWHLGRTIIDFFWHERVDLKHEIFQQVS